MSDEENVIDENVSDEQEPGTRDLGAEIDSLRTDLDTVERALALLARGGPEALTRSEFVDAVNKWSHLL